MGQDPPLPVEVRPCRPDPPSPKQSSPALRRGDLPPPDEQHEVGRWLPSRRRAAARRDRTAGNLTTLRVARPTPPRLLPAAK
uniref:Uncharacterized protein n=1 Tax=Aegilops tauschii subsp. strangulata TaxID=200361 RepID=A0A453SEH1_AEGTS